MTLDRGGVLVDCDGTLFDTNYLHTIAWSRALRDLGEWAPMNAIHRLVGMGGDQLVPELLGHELDGAEPAHDRHYTSLHGDIRAFPAAAAFLRKMHDAGLVVVLASSASQDDLDRMRRMLDADGAIDETVNADDVRRSKPDPEIFDTARRTSPLSRRRSSSLLATASGMCERRAWQEWDAWRSRAAAPVAMSFLKRVHSRSIGMWRNLVSSSSRARSGHS